MSAHPQLLHDGGRQRSAWRWKAADDASPWCFQLKPHTSAFKRQGLGFYLLFNAKGKLRSRKKGGKKSTISVHSWTGNEYVTPVRRRLAVRDGLLPAAALNDLCYDGAADERWRRAVKYPILRLLNQACRLSKHTTPAQRGDGKGGGGGGGAGRRLSGGREALVQVLDNLTAKRSDMRPHSRPGVNAITSPDCQQTCQPEGTFP